MELSSPKGVSFKVLSGDSEFVINPTAAFDGGGDFALHTRLDAPAEHGNADYKQSIYEVGEYEVDSVFITGVPNAVRRDDGSLSPIELFFTLSSFNVGFGVLADLERMPDRKTIDDLLQTRSVEIVVLDLERSKLAPALIGELVRALGTKLLIVRAAAEISKLDALLREFGTPNPQRHNKITIQPVRGGQEKLAISVLNASQ